MSNLSDKSREVFSKLLEEMDVEDIFAMGTLEYCTLYQFKDENNTTDDQMEFLLRSYTKEKKQICNIL
jgi:hypothetical protein